LLQQNTTASLLKFYFNDSMQTVYACGGASGGSQQREVADGADVVFTDTGRGSGCFGIKVRTDTAELSDTRTAGLRKYDEMCRSK